MPFQDVVEKYLRNLPDMGRSTLLCTAAHFGTSRNTLATKIAPASYRILRRNERLNRFIMAVRENPDITAREMTLVLGLSSASATKKFIQYHIGVTFTQYRQHISDGYYGM